MKITLKFLDIEQEFYNALKEYSQVRMKALVKRIGKLSRKAFEGDSMKKLLHSNVMVYILRLKQACNSPWLILNCMQRLKGSTNMRKAIEVLKYYNESKNLEEECPICYDTIADYIAEPCGHKCCKGCFDKMQNLGITNCPRCRSYIDDILPINDSTKKESHVNNDIDVKALENTAKIQYIVKLIENVTSKKEKIVIVSQWVSMLNIMRKVINQNTSIKYVSLQGNTPMKTRTQLIKSFQENDDIQVCFVSLMSSAEGINLTAANHLVLMDSWWNQSKIIQVADRIHRIGQDKEVNIYQLQIENSIEEQIEKLIKKKNKMSNLVLDKWNIKDNSKYDDSWMNDIIKLIDKPEI